MAGRYGCPDYQLEPLEAEDSLFYCPVCGEALWDEDWVYLYKGQVVGCENCVEKLHTYAAGL